MEALNAIIEFFKWSFRSGDAAFVSIVVIYAVFHGIGYVIRAIRGEKSND